MKASYIFIRLMVLFIISGLVVGSGYVIFHFFLSPKINSKIHSNRSSPKQANQQIIKQSFLQSKKPTSIVKQQNKINKEIKETQAFYNNVQQYSDNNFNSNHQLTSNKKDSQPNIQRTQKETYSIEGIKAKLNNETKVNKNKQPNSKVKPSKRSINKKDQSKNNQASSKNENKIQSNPIWQKPIITKTEENQFKQDNACKLSINSKSSLPTNIINNQQEITLSNQDSQERQNEIFLKQQNQVLIQNKKINSSPVNKNNQKEEFNINLTENFNTPFNLPNSSNNNQLIGINKSFGKSKERNYNKNITKYGLDTKQIENEKNETIIKENQTSKEQQDKAKINQNESTVHEIEAANPQIQFGKDSLSIKHDDQSYKRKKDNIQYEPEFINNLYAYNNNENQKENNKSSKYINLNSIEGIQNSNSNVLFKQTNSVNNESNNKYSKKEELSENEINLSPIINHDNKPISQPSLEEIYMLENDKEQKEKSPIQDLNGNVLNQNLLINNQGSSQSGVNQLNLNEESINTEKDIEEISIQKDLEKQQNTSEKNENLITDEKISNEENNFRSEKDKNMKDGIITENINEPENTQISQNIDTNQQQLENNLNPQIEKEPESGKPGIQYDNQIPVNCQNKEHCDNEEIRKGNFDDIKLTEKDQIDLSSDAKNKSIIFNDDIKTSNENKDKLKSSNVYKNDLDELNNELEISEIDKLKDQNTSIQNTNNEPKDEFSKYIKQKEKIENYQQEVINTNNQDQILGNLDDQNKEKSIVKEIDHFSEINNSKNTSKLNQDVPLVIPNQIKTKELKPENTQEIKSNTTIKEIQEEEEFNNSKQQDQNIDQRIIDKQNESFKENKTFKFDKMYKEQEEQLKRKDSYPSMKKNIKSNILIQEHNINQNQENNNLTDQIIVNDNEDLDSIQIKREKKIQIAHKEEKDKIPLIDKLQKGKEIILINKENIGSNEAEIKPIKNQDIQEENMSNDTNIQDKLKINKLENYSQEQEISKQIKIEDKSLMNNEKKDNPQVLNINLKEDGINKTAEDRKKLTSEIQQEKPANIIPLSDPNEPKNENPSNLNISSKHVQNNQSIEANKQNDNIEYKQIEDDEPTIVMRLRRPNEPRIDCESNYYKENQHLYEKQSVKDVAQNYFMGYNLNDIIVHEKKIIRYENNNSQNNDSIKSNTNQIEIGKTQIQDNIENISKKNDNVKNDQDKTQSNNNHNENIRENVQAKNIQLNNNQEKIIDIAKNNQFQMNKEFDLSNDDQGTIKNNGLQNLNDKLCFNDQLKQTNQLSADNIQIRPQTKVISPLPVQTDNRQDQKQSEDKLPIKNDNQNKINQINPQNIPQPLVQQFNSNEISQFQKVFPIENDLNSNLNNILSHNQGSNPAQQNLQENNNFYLQGNSQNICFLNNQQYQERRNQLLKQREDYNNHPFSYYSNQFNQFNNHNLQSQQNLNNIKFTPNNNNLQLTQKNIITNNNIKYQPQIMGNNQNLNIDNQFFKQNFNNQNNFNLNTNNNNFINNPFYHDPKIIQNNNQFNNNNNIEFNSQSINLNNPQVFPNNQNQIDSTIQQLLNTKNFQEQFKLNDNLFKLGQTQKDINLQQNPIKENENYGFNINFSNQIGNNQQSNLNFNNLPNNFQQFNQPNILSYHNQNQNNFSMNNPDYYLSNIHTYKQNKEKYFVENQNNIDYFNQVTQTNKKINNQPLLNQQFNKQETTFQNKINGNSNQLLYNNFNRNINQGFESSKKGIVNFDFLINHEDYVIQELCQNIDITNEVKIFIKSQDEQNVEYIVSTQLNIDKIYREAKKEDFVGQGSRGNIIKSKIKLTQQEGENFYAIKVLLLNSNSQQELDDGFKNYQNELLAQMHLSLKNISPFIYACAYQRTHENIKFFFVQQLLSKDLSSPQFFSWLINRTPIQRFEVYQILFEKLASMHELGYYHQDIKYQNIMADQSFKNFYFIDFGESVRRNNYQLKGTPFFFSYQKCLNNYQLNQADWHALVVTIFAFENKKDNNLAKFNNNQLIQDMKNVNLLIQNRYFEQMREEMKEQFSINFQENNIINKKMVNWQYCPPNITSLFLDLVENEQPAIPTRKIAQIMNFLIQKKKLNYQNKQPELLERMECA